MVATKLLSLVTGFALFASSVVADTVTYDFNITWVTRNPDGVFPRPVIGINGQWPIPEIRVNVNDRIVVNVNNQLGNETTSLHFHGMYQNGTTEMDGVVGATQCAIPIGGSLTYDFVVNQTGTYWYHSHANAQYPDGLRGAFIVVDPEIPFEYDQEYILTFSDWYHDQMPGMLAGFIDVTNPTGAEPVPNAALMNDTQNLTISVEPGKTYMFRMINIGAFAGQYVWFEGHTMRIIEVDGVYTDEAEADMIYITAAQRYSVLITMKNETDTNFAIVGSMDQDLFDTIPASLNPNVTGWLVYDSSADLPAAALVDEFDPFDDFTLVPYDKQELFPEADMVITMDMKMDNLGNGANYAFFNDITYVAPKVPTIFSVMDAPESVIMDASIYGPNTNAWILEKGQIIDIVLNNQDTGKHPFHLHGHQFQVIARADDDAGTYTNNVTFPAIPMRRDVLMARPTSYFVIRFVADNPGIWFFHCHIEWHLASGLIATMIEDPIAMRQNLTIPQDFYDNCAAQDIATTGNAAGNTEDWLDLKGANKSPAPLPAGFTPKGIVALVFSCIAGILGMCVIAWYGLGEMGTEEQKKVELQAERAQE